MMNQKAELLCVGNAMVDLFAEIDGEIPASWRLSEPVQHIPSGKLAEILADLPASPLAVSGGAAANAARIAGLLGISTVFAGAVGPSGDPYAAVFEADLIRAGVIPCLIRDTSPTGCCLILKTRGGGQIIAACPGAALSLAAKDVPEDRMREVRAVILDGFLLGRDVLVHRVLDLANQWGTQVALDVGSVSLAASRAGEIARYCRDYPLIVFMNEAEAEAFCRALLKDAAIDGEDAADSRGRRREDVELLKKMTAKDIFPVIVVKRGKRGAVVFAGGHVYSAPVIAIPAAETTGAGDAFCAGFMAGWIRGKPLADCAATGNKTAREVLDNPGAGADRKRLAHLARTLSV
ncbi:MAG: PfkB family carbohydrate kinase [Treponema sp.]|jgi:sugar/nucleoside kinase (ribokinase family)|nr:PfkB family carbohydrate kinase [Treponema sp.]